MDSSDPLSPLRSFRDALFACFGRRADALFESADAVLAAAPVAPVPRLNLLPLHRRGWGSVYTALEEGRVEPMRSATPQDVRRVRRTEDPNGVAVEQIGRLAARLPLGGAAALFVFDAGSDPVQLTQGRVGAPVAILVR